MVGITRILKELKSAKTVEEVRLVARKYYNDGCSIIEECFTDEDIQRLIMTNGFRTIVAHERELIANAQNGAGYYW